MKQTLLLEIDAKAFDAPTAQLPDVYTVTQQCPVSTLTGAELVRDLNNALARVLTDLRVTAGASVAVAVGSRGINQIAEIVLQTISVLKNAGCAPFIVPAMGSHGGATAEGQAAVLRDYGISQETMGVPVKATMEAVEVARLPDGYPVYFDRFALEADAVIPINRIKPHTDFRGTIESGPGKMCAIGLGKQRGAAAIHLRGAQGLRDTLPEIIRTLVRITSVVGGIGVIENQLGRTAEVHGLTATELGAERESKLLDRARELQPCIPFTDIDVLVVDEMGKNISGSGMDTHVVGRLRMPSIREDEWDGPTVRVLCVLSLTAESHGNAAGLGLADMTTQKLIESVDWNATNTNHRTSGEGGVQRGRLPLVLGDSASCVRAAIAGCGRYDAASLRLVRIRNTEQLEQMECSSAMVHELRGRDYVAVSDAAHPLEFNRPLEAVR